MSLPQKLSLISLASPRPTISVAPSSFVPPPTSPRRRAGSAQPRRSTDSWSSVEEDQTTYDWTYDHIAVLTAALERAPSNLATPYTGVIPPSNLLDAIAKEILDGRPSKSEWPHSLRATRMKLVQVAKKQARHINKQQQAKQATPNVSSSHDVMDIDDAPSTSQASHSALTAAYYAQQSRQNNMDILPIPEEPSSKHAFTSSSRIPTTPAPIKNQQHPSSSQKITPHAAFHPYKRTPRNNATPKMDEPTTPPPRHADTLPHQQPHPGSVRGEIPVVNTAEGGPSSLSTASSATLLSSMASRASLSTAVGGSGSVSSNTGGKIPSSSSKTPRRTPATKAPRRTRGELSLDIFGPELQSPAQVPATPSTPAHTSTPLARRMSAKRLRSRTVPGLDSPYAADSEVPPTPGPGLQPKKRSRAALGHSRSNSASQPQSTPQQHTYTPMMGSVQTRQTSQLAPPVEVYGDMYADDVIRPRTLSSTSSSRVQRNIRANIPPIVATPAPALQTPPTPPQRPVAPTPFLSENMLSSPGPLTPSRRGLRRVGKLNMATMSPSGRSNENSSPMQLSPSPSRRSQLRGKEISRPLSMMSATSDRSERSALSNISAHSGSHSVMSGLSALSARPPPSHAARMIGRKISFGSDHGATNGGGSGLRLHHGTLGSPGSMLGSAAGGGTPSMTMMTLAPAFELR